MKPITLGYTYRELSNVKRQLFVNSDMVYYYINENDTVKAKDGKYVYKNQLLIVRENGSKVYSSVSGELSIKSNVIHIKNDYNENDIRKKTAVKNIKSLNRSKILSKIGGIGLEYDKKSMYSALDRNNEVLVLNTIDYDLYQFNEKYTFLENLTDILDTVDLLRQEFGMLAYVVVLEDDEDVMLNVNKVIDNYPLIEFIYFNKSFPYNYNKLIHSKFLSIYDYDRILFLDAIMAYKMYLGIKFNKLLNERYITIWSDINDDIYVIKAKYGTSLESIVNSYYPNKKGYSYYVNNLFRKVLVKNVKMLRVNDSVRGLFITKKDQTCESECINCGLCHNICPMGINPLNNKDKNKDKCLKCGLCNYVCPANINLVSMEGIHE